MPTPSIPALVALTRAAAAAVLDVYARPFSVDRKADGTPLTDADRAAHEILVHGLRALDPATPVVSEESDPLPVDLGRAPSFWLVDPLDGTKEFLKRSGEFTINVALVRDGRPVLGVVHTPVTGRVHVGRIGAGNRPVALRLDPDGREVPLRCVPTDPGAVRLAASRDHGGPLVDAIEAAGPQSGVSLRRAGSSLKFCLVAEGEADLYVRDGRTMEWDTAAAQCILEASGGVVLGLDGTPLRYGKPTLANPPFVALGDPSFAWVEFLRRHRPA